MWEVCCWWRSSWIVSIWAFRTLREKPSCFFRLSLIESFQQSNFWSSFEELYKISQLTIPEIQLSRSPSSYFFQLPSSELICSIDYECSIYIVLPLFKLIICAYKSLLPLSFKITSIKLVIFYCVTVLLLFSNFMMFKECRVHLENTNVMESCLLDKIIGFSFSLKKSFIVFSHIS